MAAQESMARDTYEMSAAARYMNDLTLGQMVIGGVGLLFLLGTVIYTHLSYGWMKKTSKQEIRAYMSLTPCGIQFIADKNNIFGPLVVNIAQKNNGQTPANSVRFLAHIEMIPHPLPENFEFPEIKFSPGTNVVGPGHGFTVRAVSDVTLHWIWNFRFEGGDSKETADVRRVYVFAALEYVDAFGKTRRTRACWWYENSVLYSLGEWFEAAHKAGKRPDPIQTDFVYAERFNDAT